MGLEVTFQGAATNASQILCYTKSNFEESRKCPMKKRETRISPHHRLGSKKAISMKEVYWG